MGLGDFLSGVLGTSNNFKSNVAGPDASLYQMPNMTSDRTALQSSINQNTAAPQLTSTPMDSAAQVDPSQQAQFRTGQQSLADQLAQTAAGQGVSPADLQLQQGLQQSLAAQQSAAASAGGNVNPFLLQRQLAQGAAQAQQATNAQLGVQRAQETQAAQQALGGVLNSARGTDVQLAGQNAQLTQQTGLANQQALQQTGLANLQAQQTQQAQNQQAQQFGLSSMLGLDTTQLGANQNLAQQQVQNAQYNNSINAGVAASNQQTGNALVGGLLGAAGTLGAAAINPASALPKVASALTSDERLKTDVDRSRTDRQLDDFLGSLDVASYRYKRPEVDGAGRHFGVMAQSAARSEAGRSMVEDTPDGLKLSIPKGLSLTLASLGHLHRKQRTTDRLIEKALKRVNR